MKMSRTILLQHMSYHEHERGNKDVPMHAYLTYNIVSLVCYNCIEPLCPKTHSKGKCVVKENIKFIIRKRKITCLHSVSLHLLVF